MSVMLLILSFILGLFLGAISVSLLREDVKKDEVKEAVATKAAAPSVQSIATAGVPHVINRKGKKMCRAMVPAATVKQPSAAFRCPKCLKTVGRRGPLLTKRALKAHVQKCSA
jgi:hypothetical protein